jgi:predicted deacetylase
MRYTSARYLLRLDDACPTMDSGQWQRFEDLFDRYQVKPLVAVIPENRDPKMEIDSPDPNFWQTVDRWIGKGWRIALHGYDHVYVTKESGLVPHNKKSEFAGLPYEVQQQKIRRGYEILRDHGVTPEIWVAPSHTFDDNTLIALKEETEIRIISDGLARTPFLWKGFAWIPQQLWRGRFVGSGLWTICLHPNTTSEAEFKRLEGFLAQRSTDVVSWSEISLPSRTRNVWDWLFHRWFFVLRFLKRIYSWLR